MPITAQCLIAAFTELISKRAVLDQEHIPRLVQFATAAGVHDHSSLVQWVRNTKKVTEALRSNLLDALRVPLQPHFGPHTVIGHLAEGGMGDVWLAISDHEELSVIKTLLPELRTDDEFVLRFQREVEITSRFTNRYLVRCLDHGQADDSVFIALEYVPGGDLHNLVCSRQHLDEDEVLRIGQQIALGLVQANELNLVHRDLKPENILISDSGDAKIVDFGLARTTNADRTVLTLAGSTVGTPDYMSPEQIHGDLHLDIRSDIYAVGCVLFFCLAGHPPFEGDSIDIMRAHISSKVPDIRRINKSVGRRLRNIIETCMQKEPLARYQSPDDLAEACAQALEKRGTRRFDTSITGFTRSEVLPPAQFTEESIVDIADVDLSEEDNDIAVLSSPRPHSQPDWIVLRHQSSSRCVHLFRRDSLIIGKLRAEPVDLCLRYYPKEDYTPENSRVSRQHCRLDATPGERISITDLGSTNGLLVNNTRIPAHTAWPLSENEASVVSIPKSLVWMVKPLMGRGVIIHRPRNYSETAYAMIWSSISIGGDGCDIRLPGDSQADITLRPIEDGWEYFSAGNWQPLLPNQTYDGWQVSAGCYDDFA
ncbi:MAG: FHA domain-containing protein [Planctomycetota bacterium]|nr:MAG: FHA domain-containing protein [Planctomycetota bacterium]